MAARAVVRGDKEIRANLRAVGRAVGGREMDAMITRALTPMKEATVAGALQHRQPHNPPGGHLDQGVVIVKRDSRGSLYRVFWVTFTRRARKLAHLVEFGTAPHAQPNRGIMHPGARPFPFFRPAFEETKEGVGMSVGASVWTRISSAIRVTK